MTDEYRYFLESNIVEVKMNICLLIVITLSSTKTKFSDQPFDSNIKRYEGIRKLTTGQSGGLYHSIFGRFQICQKSL